MLSTVENLADTLIEQLKTREWVRMPASEAEYLAIAEEFPFKMEYHEGEIIAMSLATAIHERLVAYITRILTNYFFDKDFLVTGSNAGLQIERKSRGYYQPDLMVTKGEWNFKKNSKCIITNPYLLVDVLSPGTSKYDNDDKLPYYKDVESLQYIVYVAKDRPYVSVYERTGELNVWRNTDYTTLDSVAQLGDLALPLREIFHKITFSE